ncbi:MAG: phosphatase PAP2 family protein [Clostridia bacterium]|nr:phosphatase PAP2 family protein [Clostridia bacterium]
MKYDYETLYNKTADFFKTRPHAKWLLLLGNSLLTWVFFVFYAGLLLGSSFSTKELVSILFVPLLGLLTATILRLAIERPRPYSEYGANITPLIKKKSDNHSFPSRHMTCATVIAMTFLPFHPWIGGVLLLLSAVLGYCRFATGMHYPSDLLCGAGLGVLIGCFIFLL